jgi:nitrile hydratase
MNGVHDLGGMDGFTLPERDQDFPLREEWERDLWGIVFTLNGVPNSGGNYRPTLERMPPVDYLRLPYFAKWLYARERIAIERGVVTVEELADPEGPLEPFPVPADFRPLTPAEAVARVMQDSSQLLDADVPPRFAPGDAVRARNEHPEGHTRMPRYVRGHIGRVVKLHGPHVFQDELPAGSESGPQHLYTVAFAARELWGSRGRENDTIHVELWEYHLEAM